MAQCKECHEFAVEVLDLGEMVCTSCGSVADDFVIGATIHEGGKFCTGKGNELILCNQEVPNCMKQRKDIAPCLKEGKQLIKKFAAKFQLNSSTVEDINVMFQEVYQKYKTKKSKFKLLLAASCIYVTLKNMNRPFIFRDFCSVLDCKEKSFYSVYSKVKCNLPLSSNKNSASLEEQVRCALKNFPQETSDQREEFNDLVHKTVKVMKFMSKCWVVTGRSVESCIIASSFYAWKSLDTTRLKVKYDSFHSICKFVGPQRTIKDRIFEMNTVLIKAGNQLPYMKYTTLDKTNVVAYLDDILLYQGHLIDALFPAEQYTDEQEIRKYAELREKPPAKKSTDSSLEEIVLTDAVAEDELIPDSDWHIYIKQEDEIAVLEDLKAKMNYGLGKK